MGGKNVKQKAVLNQKCQMQTLGFGKSDWESFLKAVRAKWVLEEQGTNKVTMRQDTNKSEKGLTVPGSNN